MKTYKKFQIVILIVILGLLTACGQVNTSTETPDLESTTGAITENKFIELKYTSSFQVEYLDNGNKLVTDGDKRQLLLVQKGVEVPSGYENTPVIQIPLAKTVVTSESQGAFLKPSGAVSTIVGYTQNINEWYIDEVNQGITEGRVAFLGSSYALDYEKLQEMAPEIVFLTSGLVQVADKLDELGISYLMDSSESEADPMARMEWIKFYSAFYNAEEEAIAHFEKADKELEEIQAKVTGLDKPKVIWGFLFSGKAYVPYAGSYVGKHIPLAGGEYVFADLGPDKPLSAALTVEEFYAKAIIADVYISSGPPAYHNSTQDIIDRGLPLLANMKPIVEDKVWSYQPWYYQVIDETPAVIKELQAILYPELYPNYGEYKYYWKVPLAN